MNTLNLNIRGLNLLNLNSQGTFVKKEEEPSGSNRLQILDEGGYVYVQLSSGEYITLKDM